MAAGNHQGMVSPATAEPSAARRLWRVVRAVLYMLRRGLPSGRKLALDLHLLLHRGKLAGKALGDLFLAFHHHHHHSRHHAAAFSYTAGGAGVGGGGAFSCRALDPTLAVHEPAPRTRREVEFSCSNTPSSTSRGLSLLGRRRRSNNDRQSHHRQSRHHDESSASYLQCWNYDAAEVARVFEMLNDDDGALFSGDDDGAAAESAATSAAATPTRMQMMFWAVAGSCSPVVRSRTPRRVVTGESPAAAAEGGVEVDRKADEFIRRFYEQLRAQRSAASTPDYHGSYGGAAGVSPYTTPRARRPAIAAGTA